MTQTQSQDKGASVTDQIYQERSLRAKQLKEEGKKAVGYFCAYTPLEMLSAVDLVPYRILGNPRERIVSAYTYLESIMCLSSAIALKSLSKVATISWMGLLHAIPATTLASCTTFGGIISRSHFRTSLMSLIPLLQPL